jgi:hypothetical protein
LDLPLFFFLPLDLEDEMDLTTITSEVCVGEGGYLVLVPVYDCVANFDFTEPTKPSTWAPEVGFDGSFDS